MTKVQTTVGGVVYLGCAPRKGRCGSKLDDGSRCETKTRIIVIIPCSDIDGGEPGLGAVRICGEHLDRSLPALVEES